MESSLKRMIEATMLYENTLLEEPKQMERRIKNAFKNAQYDKDSHKTNWYGRFF